MMDDKGFTLMELIVVCVLIGLMMSVAVPSMRDTFFSDPLKASVRKTIGLVTGLRESAVRHQQSYFLHISQSENRIWFEKDGETEEEGEKEEEKQQLLLPEDVEIKEVWIGGDGSSVEGKTVVWVSKQGYMNPTAIRLQDDEGDELVVQFHALVDSAIISDRIEIPPQ